jgi:hypothetical protein
MRFAYADPPYPGQSKRLYGDHPDYAGEVDHKALIGRLVGEYPDGWALSTSVEAFREVLVLCPPDVRVAIWNVTNRRPFSGAGRWHQSWEPVVICGGRPSWGDGPAVRDLISLGASTKPEISGQKPKAFARWIFDLLGARPDDQLDDLFPGSGVVGREWAAFQSQDSLPIQYHPTGARNRWTPREWPTLNAANK